MPRARRLLPIVTAAILAAASAAHAQTDDRASAPPSTPGAAVYRLGTAAWPFGWSTAVGDLNADGRPDYAIADRIGRADGRFAYALELSIAGAPPRSLTFSAVDAALTVSLRDVDHDHDLDVVVSAAFSRAVVGIWLNDGGDFTRAPPSLAPADRPGDPQIDPAGAPAADGAASLLPSTPALAAAGERARIDSPATRFATRTPRAAVQLPTARLRSRAPPLA